jgi:hypothetical protein
VLNVVSVSDILLSVVIPSVVWLSVIMLSIVMLNVIMQSDVYLTVIMLSVVTLSVIMPSVATVSETLSSVIMLSVIIVIVAAPSNSHFQVFSYKTTNFCSGTKFSVMIVQFLSNSCNYFIIYFSITSSVVRIITITIYSGTISKVSIP